MFLSQLNLHEGAQINKLVREGVYGTRGARRIINGGHKLALYAVSAVINPTSATSMRSSKKKTNDHFVSRPFRPVPLPFFEKYCNRITTFPTSNQLFLLSPLFLTLNRK